MSGRQRSNIGASVRQRLLNRARTEGRTLQELATLFAMERFLFRLGASTHSAQFVLKGGLMTLTWAGEFARVTRDIDLLGRGANSIPQVVARLRDVLAVGCDDGVVFDLESVRGEEIRVETAYVGVRALFDAHLSGMRIRMQVDVGFGDAVVPEPKWVDYPQLLDLGAPRVLGYPAEATLAEKLHAVVILGLANSRLKDYYDLWTAHRRGVSTADGLAEAIVHTFARRGTPLPHTLPEGLTATFAKDASKQAQWDAFRRRSGLEAPPLGELVEEVARLANAAFERARQRGGGH